MPIVRMITSAGAATWMSCSVRNCAEPANTMDDMLCASAGVSPARSAAAP